MQAPSIGKQMLCYRPAQDETLIRNGDEPLLVLPTAILPGNRVNIVGWDASNAFFQRTNVLLLEGSSALPRCEYPGTVMTPKRSEPAPAKGADVSKARAVRAGRGRPAKTPAKA